MARMPRDRPADVRHHTQLSPGNCVNRMNLQWQQWREQRSCTLPPAIYGCVTDIKLTSILMKVPNACSTAHCSHYTLLRGSQQV